MKTESEKEMRGISNEMHNRLAAIDLLVRSFTWWRKGPASYLNKGLPTPSPTEDVGNHDQNKGLNENPQRTSIPSVMLTQPAPGKWRQKNK